MPKSPWDCDEERMRKTAITVKDWRVQGRGIRRLSLECQIS
jgi:hypothetical protein